ncbi:negative regulation of nuclease [Porites harrisoni]
MPEGPELYKNAQMVNRVCKGLVFSGKIMKSAVSTKNPDVSFPAREYSIHAESRGKEMALVLTSLASECKSKVIKQENGWGKERMRILFRFGMSGKFTFGPVKDVHKHAHLNFYTKDKPLMVLSFVDVRRFGRWELTDEWSKNRGPDPMFEYKEFRSNILDSLEDKIFDKPLCEVMHNQKYFNGIGNYLRAEIIFRSGIPPFSCARSALEKLRIKKENDVSEIHNHKKVKLENCLDILDLCNLVPKEVINLPGKGYDPSGNHSDYSGFTKWLQCYYNSEMRNLVDHDGRTMWFKGEAGPMVPKEAKSRGMQKSRKRKTKEENKEQDNDANIKVELSSPKKPKTKAPPVKTKKKENSKKKVVKKQCKTKTSVSKKEPVRRSLRIKRARERDGL